MILTETSRMCHHIDVISQNLRGLVFPSDTDVQTDSFCRQKKGLGLRVGGQGRAIAFNGLWPC